MNSWDLPRPPRRGRGRGAGPSSAPALGRWGRARGERPVPWIHAPRLPAPVVTILFLPEGAAAVAGLGIVPAYLLVPCHWLSITEEVVHHLSIKRDVPDPTGVEWIFNLTYRNHSMPFICHSDIGLVKLPTDHAWDVDHLRGRKRTLQKRERHRNNVAGIPPLAAETAETIPAPSLPLAASAWPAMSPKSTEQSLRILATSD